MGGSETMTNYEFQDFKDFFSYQLRERLRDSKGRKKATLQRLAQKLGYNSPSILSMLAKGTRLPSEKMLDALFQEWQVDKKAQNILRLKVALERQVRRGQPVASLLDQLVHMEPKGTYLKLDLNQFQFVREWYNLVVRALVGTPEFVEDANWISQRLRKKVSPTQVKTGIEAMLKIGALARDPATQSLVRPEGDVESTNNLPSEAIKEHHRGMMNRALEALDEQTTETRQMSAATLGFDPSRLDEAKTYLHHFVKDFNERFGATDSSRVFQLNIQFFEHTCPSTPATEDQQ